MPRLGWQHRHRAGVLEPGQRTQLHGAALRARPFLPSPSPVHTWLYLANTSRVMLTFAGPQAARPVVINE